MKRVGDDVISWFLWINAAFWMGTSIIGMAIDGQTEHSVEMLAIFTCAALVRSGRRP